jgi:thioredoxin 1
MANVKRVTTATFENEVLRSETPVLVDFHATWCMPCRMLSPVLEKLSQEFEGRVKIVKVDVDEEPDLARGFEISAVPTLKIFDLGHVKETIQGLASPQALRAKLDATCAAPSGAPGV